MLLARVASAEDDRRQTVDDGSSSAVVGPSSFLTARQALELATLGGAAVLGRDDIGALATGKCADLFAINLNRLDYAGALLDPVAAVIFCAPQYADYVLVHGRFVVKNGEVVTTDIWRVVERHNQIARQMIRGA
jgi:cytosine/adenosine deaminase-related metal-dependent hydrolase